MSSGLGAETRLLQCALTFALFICLHLFALSLALPVALTWLWPFTLTCLKSITHAVGASLV